MSLLHSYSFVKEVDRRSYLPFAYSEKMGNDIDCTLEVIEAAALGKINLDKVEEAALEEGSTDKAFNLYAYNRKVHKNRKMVLCVESGRVMHISDVNDDGSVEPYGVPESVVAEYAGQTDEYEKLIEEDEVQYAAAVINDMKLIFLVDYRMDFWRCMRQALRGIPESVALLRSLAEEAPEIGELIWIILSNSKDVDDLIQSVTA